MPIYEYHCLDCKKGHEIIQKFSDPPLTICPACGGELEKKLSLSSFQLKGGGWYKESYSSPSSKKGETRLKTPKSDTSIKDETSQKKTEK